MIEGKIHLFSLIALVWLAGQANGDVLYVSSSGQNGSVKEIAGIGSVFTIANLPFPEGLAFDPQGNLYVALARAQQIDKISPGGILSVYETGLTGGVGPIAFDKQGNLYAGVGGSQMGKGAIDKITPNGTLSVLVDGLPSPPQGLAVDTNGNIFDADGVGNFIEKISPTGVDGFFNFDPDEPLGVTFDKSGELYVANAENNTVVKFTPSVSSIYATVPSVLYGLTFDSAGNLYTTGYTSGVVTQTRPDGTMATYAADLGNVTFIADPTTALPEPATFSFLGVGSLSLLARRRRV